MKIVKIVLICLVTYNLSAQQTLFENLSHDGINREYILYVPDSYDPNQATPLLFNFHGYTSNAEQQMFYGDFRPIADREGFIIVHPQGTLDINGNTYFNAAWGGDVDDVGFSAALIDHISTSHNINQERVYSTGMSNGGFMSYTLACELSHRIAAIASVTGTMVVQQIDGSSSCSADHPMPVLEIHGTADDVVPYNGNLFMAPINEVMNFWIAENNCDPNPSEIALPNTNPNDQSTVDHLTYSDCDNNVKIELMRVNGGGHTWPGTLFSFPVTNQDINASEEIWKFFSRYDVNGLINTSSTEALTITTDQFILYPNPVTDILNYHSSFTNPIEITVSNNLGQRVIRTTIDDSHGRLDVSSLSNGLYIFSIDSYDDNYHKPIKFIINN